MPLKFWGNRKSQYNKSQQIDNTPLLGSNTTSGFTDITCSSSSPNRVTSCRSIFEMQEQCFDTKEKFNKIFCSTWIGNDIIFGTKDNKVILFDSKSGSMDQLEIPCGRNNGPSSASQMGVHVAKTNMSQSHFVVNGTRNEDLALFNSDTMKCEALLVGHTNWVYGAEWIETGRLLSGGRDNTLMIWDLENQENNQSSDDISCLNGTSVLTMTHTPRAMTMQFYSSTTLFTVTSEGHVCSWDITKGKQVTKTRIRNARETVSMTSDSNGIVIGGKSEIYLMDPRQSTKRQFQCVPSLDSGLGVRSIQSHGSHVTIGGGSGYLSALDTRTQRYLNSNSDSDSTSMKKTKGKKKKVVKISRGWIRRDKNYAKTLRSFPSESIPTCIYSHSYHPTSGALFAAGGPTMARLFGSTISVFA